LQDEIFPDKEHFGVSLETTTMSSMGIIQISAIMGSCVGGAYLPIMTRLLLEGSIFLAGSYLVKAAETIDNETLVELLHIAKLVLLIIKPKTTKTRLTK
jgi:acetyl-CoA carboxylase carboxyltransferase component